MEKAKPFESSKREVWESFKLVKAKKGSAGVDEQTIAEFEKDLANNLYKLWNRMSSGSYFPLPVKRVEIPKEPGKTRPLGIPTVADRIAQTVVKRQLEPILEGIFHEDSYGYRPGKSAKEAIDVTRVRCWRNNWVLDLDIKGFFDAIDHDLLMKAVRHHTDCRWTILYIERWLKAPVEFADGTLQARNRGTPQGGVISPLLANLFLHYVFDMWMERKHRAIPFARYADDCVCHCKTEGQSKQLLDSLVQRFSECGLELHPEKTKIVYCKDDDRRGNYPNQSFDFLGYTFRPRRSKNRYGKYFINFTPAVSNKAAKKIKDKIRSWRLCLQSDKTLEDLARMMNPVIRGWINYFGHFYKPAMYQVLRYFDEILVKWAMRKYKKLRGHHSRTWEWLRRIWQKEPTLFVHWKFKMAGQ